MTLPDRQHYSPLWDGEELGDPGWYIPGELYKCTCCGGSGDGADCTFW